MKRSDVKNKLFNLLTRRNYVRLGYGADIVEIDIHEVDIILRTIEELGMLPPLIKVACTDVNGKPFYNFKNRWEDE